MPIDNGLKLNKAHPNETNRYQAALLLISLNIKINSNNNNKILLTNTNLFDTFTTDANRRVYSSLVDLLSFYASYRLDTDPSAIIISIHELIVQSIFAQLRCS